MYPPFNSLDRVQGLSLGSAVVVDLSDLSVRVGGLREGIPYYFRTRALNEVGYGPWMTSSPRFEVPFPQQPGLVSDVGVSVVDGDSLLVSFQMPERDGGGKGIDKYRVEWNTAKLVDEIQEVRVNVAVSPEVQVVSTATDDTNEVQLVHLYSAYVGTPPKSEVQRIFCDATGGSFSLSFQGQTTSPINWDEDDLLVIKAELEELDLVENVVVSFFGGQTQACGPCNPATSQCTGGFDIKFLSVVGFSGDLDAVKANTNGLQGARRMDVVEYVTCPNLA